MYLLERINKKNHLLSSEFGWRCRVRSHARCWLQLIGCAALLMVVTIFIPSHTLFLWTIPWTLSYKNNDLLISWSWSYLISWSYLLIISYLTDDLQHVLDAYFGYYLHALDMCYTQLTHAIHFWCCASHACSMFYLWLTHVRLAAYMLTLVYIPSIHCWRRVVFLLGQLRNDLVEI